MLQVRDMTPDDEYFVGTCSHVNESDELDACGARRIEWLRKMKAKGFGAKVALADGEHAGCIFYGPIDTGPWGVEGRDLTFIPCLWVLPDRQKHGAGRALVSAVEEQARRASTKGVATVGFHWDFWFMPAGFFQQLGYTETARQGDAAILWKTFDDSAEAPSLRPRRYEFEPVPGIVAIDLFWTPFCQTSDIEAQRVREVAAEFGEAVVLREYPADDPEALARFGIPRAIYVNGEEIGWGYEAPREGIREAIEKAMGE